MFKVDESSNLAAKLRLKFEQYDIRHQCVDLGDYGQFMCKSAVLIPLVYRDGEFYVILTQRSDNMRHHASVVALPGGRMDKEDKDEIQTALREAEEEIGLAPSNVDIIGIFTPNIVSPNFVVYPVMGLVKKTFTPVINEKEVSMVFELPLKRFLSKDGLSIKALRNPVTYIVHYFVDMVNDKKIETFGFTALLCIYTAIGVYQTDDTFEFYKGFKVNKENLFTKPFALKKEIENFAKALSTTKL